MSAAEETNTTEDAEDAEFTLANSDVCTKYREAGRIASLALQGIKSQVVDGASIVAICKFGDTVITQACSTIYQKKVKGAAVEKGIAFPTCVSVNEMVCHNCPLDSDPAPVNLKTGDMVKIDLGVHVDGNIAVLAHTLIVGSNPTPEAPLTDAQGNLFHCAHVMAEVATKLIRPTRTNEDVTVAWEKVAAAYGVNMMEGTLSHQMKRYVIDGNKVIIGKRDHTMKVDTATFEQNEVYSVDICLSTGDGKPKQSEQRTTVFKRAVDKTYRLKMKASRYLFNEMNSKFPTLPFALRAYADEKQARMGVVECQKHDLVVPYPVLLEKEGALVVHFKFTILLLPSGTTRITEGALDPACFTTESEVPEDIKTILAMSSKTNKKKKNKKKAAPTEAAK
jgi:curved DNA binding protein